MKKKKKRPARRSARVELDPGPGDPEPTLSDWKRLYSAAFDLWKAAPWEWMTDTDLFAVKNPADEKIAYCSVIGAMRRTFGLVTFLGTSGLETWRWMQGRGETMPEDEFSKELIFRHSGLSLTFRL